MSEAGQRRRLLGVVTVLRDEEAASLEPFVTALRAWGGELVDEICVYDTTASHVAAAEADRLGITEKRGFWDRELGRARNEAIALAKSSWVLVLDPDERPVGDVGALRRELRATRDDILLTEVSDGDASAKFGRVLRRGAVSYIASESEFTSSALTPHRSFGLLDTEALAIQRDRRDLGDGPEVLPRRLARLRREATGAHGDQPERLAEIRLLLAHEYRLTGSLGQALTELEELSHGGPSDPGALTAIEARADLLVGQGRLAAADHVLQQLEDGPNPEYAAWLRLHWHLARGESRQALQILRTQEAPTPTGGAPLSSESVLRLRFRLAQREGDSHETLTSLLALMAIGEEIAGRGKLLLKLWGKRTPADLAEVILSTGTGHVDAIAQELQRTSPAGAVVARGLRKRRSAYSVAAVVIARDEARCIERCVRSVLPWVDEVVVADTGSQDDTRRLAAAAGARVVSVPWTDDFAAARNAALDAANADWHLIIDADEILTGNSSELLKLREIPPAYVFALHVVSTFRLGDTLEREVENQSRLLPGGIRYSGIIHAVPEHDLPVVNVAMAIEHDGYEPEQLSQKLPRREKLLRKAVAAEPENPYLRYQLGRNLETQGRFEEAAAEYGQVDSASVESEGWHHILVVQYAHTLKCLGLHREALQYLAHYSGRYDSSPDFHFVVGNVLLDLAASEPRLAVEVLPQAAREFRRCLQIGVSRDLQGHVPGRAGLLASHNLSVVLDGCRALGIPVEELEETTEDHARSITTGALELSGVDAASAGQLPDGSLDAVMIVKNEEKNLGRALASLTALRPLLGEICVYDTGSSDGTIELARSFGARVLEGYWDDNYSRARNAAAAMSDADWLLVVDADETVWGNSKALAEALAEADRLGREILSVEVSPDERYVGRGREWMSPRLYRPDFARYARPVHAELRRVDGSLFVETPELSRDVVRLKNFGVDPERLSASNRRSVYLSGLALGDKEVGRISDRLAALVDRARALRDAGDVEGAILDLREAISLRCDTTYFVWAHQMLADIYLGRGELDEVGLMLQEIKGLRPVDGYTDWVEARLLAAREEYRLASSLFLRLGAVVNALGLPVSEEEVSSVALRAAVAAQDEVAVLAASLRLADARQDAELKERAQRLGGLIGSSLPTSARRDG